MPSSTTSSELRVELGPQPARVLLVDDNAGILAHTTAVLSSVCRVVGAVKDGWSALDAAARLQPDVIVLDISMPGLNGLDVARRLRQNGSRAEIVFLTVHDDEEFVGAGRAAGGIGYVIKARLAADLPLAVLAASHHQPFVSAHP
jgi:DNA-binding NarL/FixJ family response regulator